jgi:hypothetical protein
MALRFPINSGSWSNPAIWSGSLIPTSIDDVHANNRTVLIDQDVIVNSLKTIASGSAVAGGGFILDNNYTVTALDTNLGILAGTTTVITYSGSQSARINGVVRSSQTTVGIFTIFKSGTGFLTLSGSYNSVSGLTSTRCIYTTGSGRLDITASKYVFGNQATSMYTKTMDVRATSLILNMSGDIAGGAGASEPHVRVSPENSSSVIYFNLVGDVADELIGQNNGALNFNTLAGGFGTIFFDLKGNILTYNDGNAISVSNGQTSNAGVNLFMSMTGSVIASKTGFPGFGPLNVSQGNNYINISGSVINTNSLSSTISSGDQGGFMNLTIQGGIVSTTGNSPAISNRNQAYITLKDCIVSASIFSPAVSCSRTDSYVILDGCQLINSRQVPGSSKVPVLSQNMYMKPNSNTRWTMWDPTQTNQYTMYAQGFVPDSPQISDVRFGTSYLGGTLSGSMVVPNSGSVLFGVQVDNGTGSYSITSDQVSEAIWNKPVSNLTGSGTIGQRLANSSTVSSTGAQIAAFGI